MLAIHPNARTTPAVRAEIACSSERSGVLARRYGVSTETVRTSGASVGRPSAGTAPVARISCPGRRARRSAPWSARCVAPPASRWMT
jgi:hypothetical protein